MIILKKVIHKLRKVRDLSLLRASGFFDKDWYLKNNQDVAEVKADPLLHYYDYGGLERRDPGPNFSSGWCMDTYPDVQAAGINPLVHYLIYGRNEGRMLSAYPIIKQCHKMEKRMVSSNRNWLNSINGQIDFYKRANRKDRTDSEFPWDLVDNEAKLSDQTFCSRTEQVLEWINSNAEPLWESRSLLNDELSKLLFDATLVLRSTGFQKFYFPRIDFDDLVEIVDEKPFPDSDLPGDFLGIPLRIFDIRWRDRPNAIPVKIVCCKDDIVLLNSYRQYLMRRDSIDISPVSGDIVLDCGACIGDVSLLFAGLVAMQGEVHLFDPIPLHARYCWLQASLNPSLAHMLHVNELAVGNRTYVTSGDKSDSDKIEPGGLAINSYACTSLDDYASSKLSRVDFIKMDIEGAEMEAIDGAAKIIREFKPRLAISVYHKADDLWEIPIKLKSLNPSYELYFGHHSPVIWESVIYAVQR